MLIFDNGEASLKLEIVHYELPAGEGDPESDDRNWLTMRCTWTTEDGEIYKDSNGCILTYELQEWNAALKVVGAGIHTEYYSEFVSPYFAFSARAQDEEHFHLFVSFYMPNRMDGDDTAEIECTVDRDGIRALTDELDSWCKHWPDRP